MVAVGRYGYSLFLLEFIVRGLSHYFKQLTQMYNFAKIVKNGIRYVYGSLLNGFKYGYYGNTGKLPPMQHSTWLHFGKYLLESDLN